MKRRQAEILLALVILARSTSFLFSKTALEEMGLFELLALRFLLAFFLLALLYGRRLWREVGKSMILRGAVLGTVLYLVMAAEMMALRQSDIYVTAFLENTAFLFVPFFLWAGKGKRISWKTGQAMILMMAGVSLLTVKGAGIHPGALWAMAAAFFYGLFIYLTGLLARRGDGLSLGIWQMGFMGLWNGCSALALGEWAMPSYAFIAVNGHIPSSAGLSLHCLRVYLPDSGAAVFVHGRSRFLFRLRSAFRFGVGHGLPRRKSGTFRRHRCFSGTGRHGAGPRPGGWENPGPRHGSES